MQLFTCNVNVKRRTFGAPDAYGESTETWAYVEEDIAVDLQPASGDLLKLFGGQAALSSHWLCLAYDVDIKPDDRVEDSDGNLYVVDAVRDWKDHIEAALSIENKE